MNDFELKRPLTEEKLFSMIMTADKDTVYLAGGTDLIIALNSGKLMPACIIDLSAISSLKNICYSRDGLLIGPMTTFSDLERSYEVREYASALFDSVSRMGSTQIRNVATIGGNICNLNPAADGTVALVALNADVQLLFRNGEIRWERLDRYLSERLDKRCEDVFVKKIRISGQTKHNISAFVKLGARTSVTISQLSLACSLKFNEPMDTIRDAIFVLGSVGRRCVCDMDTSNWAIGKKIDVLFQRELSSRLQYTIEQAIPKRASMSYKRIAIEGLSNDLMKKIIDRMHSKNEEISDKISII